MFHVHVDQTIDIDPPLAHILSELVTGIHAHSLAKRPELRPFQQKFMNFEENGQVPLCPYRYIPVDWTEASKARESEAECEGWRRRRPAAAD